MSKQAVIDLLTRLSNDREEAQRFKEDPDRAMAGLDLTEQEKELLKSGSREEIQAHIGPTTSPLAISVIIGGGSFGNDGE